MRQGKRHITYDSTHQLVSAANAQTYALSVTYGDWGKIQQYDLSQTDLASNVATSQTRYYSYGSLNEGQTTFAPNSISYADGTNVNEQYGIGGSLQRRETNIPGNQPNEELYRFGADGNLRLYSYDRLFYTLYGYDGGTTRTYKYSFDLNPNWVNGRLESVNFNLHNAMFYPNSYINFNNNGYYTKHYYNGMERIASRLGDNNLLLATHDPELQDRKDWQDSLIRKNVTEITGYDFLPVGEEQNPEDPKPVFELPQVGITNLIQNTSSIYYYHTNHLGSTCYVTDGNASVVQGFLYAPFGEITNEHNVGWQSGTLPKYSFNAKELDEETGMYYYEARYYQPPTFISRDPLFEKYPTFSPYAYCANNPVNVIDPDGRDTIVFDNNGLFSNRIQASGRHMGRVLDKNGNKRFDFEFACQLDADRCCRPGSPEEEKIMGRDKLPHGKNCPEEERVPIYYIKLVWQKDIISQLEASGACDNNDVPILYALSQSSDGKIDFANNNRKKDIWNDNTLYIPMVPGKKYAHNVSNMGNFLWGAAMQKMGIGKKMTFLGSNLHAKWKHGEYDSFDDQLSIWLGYSYGSSIQTNRKK